MAYPRSNSGDGVTTRAGARKELLSLAWPVLATLVADPLAGIVALWFIGLLDNAAAQVAACGTATSIFNTTLKVFVVPLLSVATSAMAAVKGRSDGDPVAIGNAASSAIITALGMSCIQILFLGFGAPLAAVIWQAPRGTDMYTYLIRYLWVRGFGAPITLLMLTLQGVFRGLKEVKEPLYATIINNLANVVLCPIMLFVFKLESPGAAASILLGEAAACTFLLVRLSRRYPIRLASTSTFRELASLLPATGWLMLRTASLTTTYALANAVVNTTAALTKDPRYSAAHTVMFSLWIATTMLSDSLAVAAQTMISASLAKMNHFFCHVVVAESVRLAFFLGLILTLVTYLARDIIPHFTSDPGVVSVMSAFVGFIILTQPITSQAFVWDGILYGVSGFKYASAAISAACVIPISLILVASYSDQLMAARQGWDLILTFGDYLTSHNSIVLTWVWLGLSSLMLMRFLVIAVPFFLQTYPFALLFQPSLADVNDPLLTPKAARGGAHGGEDGAVDGGALGTPMSTVSTPKMAPFGRLELEGERQGEETALLVGHPGKRVDSSGSLVGGEHLDGSVYEDATDEYEPPVLSHVVDFVVDTSEGSGSEGGSHHRGSQARSLLQGEEGGKVPELEPGSPMA